MNYIYTCLEEPYDILKVKNNFARPMYYVTKQPTPFATWLPKDNIPQFAY